MTLGFKDFVAGDVLTAAQVDGYLMRQTVMVFATDAARDSALSGNLEEGMHCYTEDNNRLYYYTGAAWTVVSEPPQSWAGAAVVQATPVTGTTNRGWYQRRNGCFEAHLVWTATAAGTASNLITVSTPLTLSDANDSHGTFMYNDAGVYYSGSIHPTSTTTVSLVIQGASGGLGLLSPTIAIGDILYMSMFGRY
jgi:hypothetical protein